MREVNRLKSCVYCPACNLPMKNYQAGNIPMIGSNYDKMYQAFQCQKCELYALIKFYKGEPKGDMI